MTDAPDHSRLAPARRADAAGVPHLLATAPLKARGFIANASNHTLLVQVGEASLGLHAVYKPQAGERPLWDFSSGSLGRREVAAYVVSEALGWGLVPPTVLREDAPMGAGSVQLFVPHDPREHYFTLVEDERTHGALVRFAVFDLLTNNADRKASHILRSDDGWIYGCDHGLTFHAEPKVRTVIWDLDGRPVTDVTRRDVARLARELADAGSPLRARLRELLAEGEITALASRAAVLQGLRALPAIDPDRRAYPWPPL